MNKINVDKIKSLELGYKYFFKNKKNELFENIISELYKINNDFDVEFCLFYNDCYLINNFKFSLFVHKNYIGQFIKLIKNIKIIRSYKNIEIKGLQFNFKDNIIESYSFIYVKYIRNNLVDISIKFNRKNNLLIKEVRNYIHNYPFNYINNKKISIFKSFIIIDLIKLRKNFFGKEQYSYYFFFKKGIYTYSDIEDSFNVSIPNYITRVTKSPFCICISKEDYFNKKYDNISIYFGTYGLGI